jgi:hypothetical protein
MSQWNHDHGRAEHEGRGDPPVQDAVLVGRGDRERPEDDDEDEEVIDGERELDEVAGEELDRSLRSEAPPDEPAEEERDAEPDRDPGQRLPGLHHLVLPVEDAEVEGQEEHDEDQKPGP